MLVFQSSCTLIQHPLNHDWKMKLAALNPPCFSVIRQLQLFLLKHMKKSEFFFKIKTNQNWCFSQSGFNCWKGIFSFNSPLKFCIFFFSKTFICLISSANLGTKRVRKLIFPKNDCNSFLFLGKPIFWIDYTLPGSI